MSTASLVVACVGMQHGVRQWLHEEGWLKFTGLNWTTGETYSQPFWDRAISEAMLRAIQFLENSDLLFNTAGGAIRVRPDVHCWHLADIDAHVDDVCFATRNGRSPRCQTGLG